MVVRIPYSAMIAKYFAVAREVATMTLLRSSRLPIPEVYGYSLACTRQRGRDRVYLHGIRIGHSRDIWFGLGEGGIISISHQLAELGSKMMSIVFPAGGSPYYTEDLKVAGRPGTPEDRRFYIGPDTRLPLRYGRRSQLDVDRGSCRPLSPLLPQNN